MFSLQLTKTRQDIFEWFSLVELLGIWAEQDYGDRVTYFEYYTVT